MNANRNNNRRRGRGNNRGQGGHGNRIDSRARGNAPQMLEKYKKLAHDASLNDDRVQTEYYLQFADHYFRVMAENKAQKDEPRPRRGDNDRDQSSDDDDQDGEDEFDTRGRQNQRNSQDNRDQRDRGDSDDEAESDSAGDDRDDTNPFVRESRTRTPRRRTKADGEEAKPRKKRASAAPAEGDSVDPGVLPPSIKRDEEPKAKRPARRSRSAPPAEDGGEEALEAVN